MAIKKYVVTSCGTKKDTGEFYCWAQGIRTWKTGSTLDQNDRLQLDEPYEVGDIIEVDQQIVGAK